MALCASHKSEKIIIIIKITTIMIMKQAFWLTGDESADTEQVTFFFKTWFKLFSAFLDYIFSSFLCIITLSLSELGIE